jgi:spore coat protein U-like protein
MNLKKSVRIALVTAATVLGAGSAGDAIAATATSNLSVTATVSDNCLISTTAVAFGAYDPIGANKAADKLATGTVSTTCTSGSAPVITLGQGANAAGGSSDPVPLRRMAAGAGRLAYFLYQDTGPSTTVWGNTAGTAPASVAGDGTLQAVNVYGIIPMDQQVIAGSYTDTVVATVTF